MHILVWRDHAARLMQADPDRIPGDKELSAFAIAMARPLYDRHCASCHGLHLEGDRLRGVPPLSRHDWLYGDGRATDIEQTILYGIRAGNARSRNLATMPAFARPQPSSARRDIAPLTPDEIRDVVEFLLVEAGHTGDAAGAARGGRVYADKGGCFDCHAPDARGDSSIGAPNLLTNTRLYGDGSRAGLIDTVSFGRGGICPAWFQQLSPVEIRSLAVFIQAASHD